MWKCFQVNKFTENVHGNKNVKELGTVVTASECHNHWGQCVPVGPQRESQSRPLVHLLIHFSSSPSISPEGSTSNSGGMLAGPGPLGTLFLPYLLPILQAYTKDPTQIYPLFSVFFFFNPLLKTCLERVREKEISI